MSQRGNYTGKIEGTKLTFLDRLKFRLFKYRLASLESKKRSMVKQILKAIDESRPDEYIQNLRNKLEVVNKKIEEL